MSLPDIFKLVFEKNVYILSLILHLHLASQKYAEKSKSEGQMTEFWVSKV